MRSVWMTTTVLVALSVGSQAPADQPTRPADSEGTSSSASEDGRSVADRFAAIDTDGDGRIARSEYLEVGMRRFTATDVDGNSTISLAEYRALSE